MNGRPVRRRSWAAKRSLTIPSLAMILSSNSPLFAPVLFQFRVPSNWASTGHVLEPISTWQECRASSIGATSLTWLMERPGVQDGGSWFGGMPTPLSSAVGPVPPSSVWKHLPVPIVSQPPLRKACGSDVQARGVPEVPEIAPAVVSKPTLAASAAKRLHRWPRYVQWVQALFAVQVVQHWPLPPELASIFSIAIAFPVPVRTVLGRLMPQSACRK
mmetsp:Transcript_60053/g.166230  ORF Transcript_60053/g.166230 Transcript_60053/m.166230 type:complete len:216 (+) Transcript_60053:219-866(+)